MRQIPFKRLSMESDISGMAIMEAINTLYNPGNNRTMQETKFLLLVGVDAFKTSLIDEATELKCFNIDLVMCKILKADMWAIFCPDTNDILISEGA